MQYRFSIKSDKKQMDMRNSNVLIDYQERELNFVEQ